MKKGFGATDRVDDWWTSPLAMATYLGIMIVYATWRGFMEADFWVFHQSSMRSVLPNPFCIGSWMFSPTCQATRLRARLGRLRPKNLTLNPALWARSSAIVRQSS